MSISKKEITIYPQTFTSSQQNIARNNISAVSLADVKSDISIDTMNRIDVPKSNVYVCLAKFEKNGGQINGNIWLNFSSNYTRGSIGFYTINVRNNSTGTTLYNKSITGQQNRSLPINLYFNPNDNYYYIIADTTGRFNVGEESYEILWQWLGYNTDKAILADTTNLETFSDISDLTPVSWSIDGYIIVNNAIEYASSAGYATTATNATYAGQCNSANYAITANYALASLSANNANMVDGYHIVVGTTGTATNTIYFV